LCLPLFAAKLPGAPVLITALAGPGSAELTTDQVSLGVKQSQTYCKEMTCAFALLTVNNQQRIALRDLHVIRHRLL
jgi:hypothetical protein